MFSTLDCSSGPGTLQQRTVNSILLSETSLDSARTPLFPSTPAGPLHFWPLHLWGLQGLLATCIRLLSSSYQAGAPCCFLQQLKPSLRLLAPHQPAEDLKQEKLVKQRHFSGATTLVAATLAPKENQKHSGIINK